MLNSMTGFASASGQSNGTDWSIDMRSVNHKSLDVRLRLPDVMQPLETALRKTTAQSLARGSVQISIRLGASDDQGLPVLDKDRLDWALGLLADVQSTAQAKGAAVQPIDPVALLALRPSVLGASAAIPDVDWAAILMPAFEQVLVDLCAMRASEGAALETLLQTQLDGVEMAVKDAKALLPDRTDRQRSAVQQAVTALTAQSVDPDRFEQELALIAVKSDITEELDRLNAHIDAARALLADPAPCGRRLDFLMQEFNREANTLCSKAGDIALTRIGLDLKAIIDQMREQVQNVE